MSEFVYNNVTIGDNMDQGQRLGDQASCNVPINLSTGSLATLMMLENPDKPNYCQSLMFELMNRIPPIPPEISHMEDKIVDRVAYRNPKIYDGQCSPMKLKEWIRSMEMILTMIDIP